MRILGPEAALALVPLAFTEGEAIAVVFYTQGGESTSVLAQSLRELGVDPQIVGEDYIETYVPLQQLAAVSNLAGVGRIDAMIPPLPAQSTGPPFSPALSSHGVQAWWTVGYTGQGVKVGIIDRSFTSYRQAVQAGEVPAPAGVRCYFPRGDWNLYSWLLANCGGRWHGMAERVALHGTAVAEALVDIAPDVTVYLASVHSRGQLRAAVKWLVEQDVDIINHSVAWSWDGPGDGTSPHGNSPLHTVDYAVQNGIIWFNGAGNFNPHTWYGSFSPSKTVPEMFQKTPWYWHSFTGTGLLKQDRCSLVKVKEGKASRDPVAVGGQ